MLKKSPVIAFGFMMLMLAGSIAHAVPSEIDWRTTGAVTIIQDQGDVCNFSWAFAATGAIEGAITIDTGGLPNLSEQQLIDCGGVCGAPAAAQCGCPQLGCSFSYVDTNGLCTEAAYPFSGQSATCRQGSCTAVSNTGSVNWSQITPGSEADLVTALLTAGPVVARLEVGHHGQLLPAYEFYGSGVLVPPSWDTTVVQWVLVVGYTPTYFIIKNSLGTGWGEAGYLRLARGGNYLGVANFAYTVNLSSGAAPVPAAPCEAAASVPALSLGATAGLMLLLVLVALSGFRSLRTI